MKYVVTAAEMQWADQYTSEKLGLPSLVLMERAAMVTADEICKRFSSVKRAVKVCIACGSGNNGGDGFALGRILNERGFTVHFFMAKEDEKASEANRVQKEILGRLGHTVSTGQPMEEYDIVVDALFGTGLHREITGCYGEMICCLNRMKGYKVAVDIPSGINSDDGRVLGCVFQADLTVTFAFHKWGHLLYPGKDFCGEVVCKDIGIPEMALYEKMPYGRMLQKADLNKYLPQRVNNSHKGTYGKAGVIAGSVQMGGAVILCSRAAMKMGVGYTKVITAKANREALLAAIPEALLYFFEGYSYPLEMLEDCNALAVGPGIGTDRGAESLIEAVLDRFHCSLVLDADGINILAKRKDLQDKLKIYAKAAQEKGGTVILTPHKKEFSRLTGISMEAEPEKWQEEALKVSAELGAVLVLKDAATRIYTPEGLVYVNTTGNPGMSTAGSGDVLTGIICGLAAQMKDGAMAAALGVYIHGLCGDHGAKEGNLYSLTAGEMADALKYVLKGDAEDESL
ncbi:MAG: NAD(P)H-hydrate dehydratase [Lachnospiraceae bacterium]|nr:NAD(P)H-hydrate dehydratase [Lachnospiraceae bacterium]